MAKHQLRIDFDDDTGDAKFVLFSRAAVDGQAASVGIPLCFDPDNLGPELKPREGETEERYGQRFAETIPPQLNLAPELVAGLAAQLKAIVAAAGGVGGHYAGRAAKVHSLLAKGQVPEGVTHQIGIRRAVKANGDAKLKQD